jgi:two-component system NtrC family sensor kinase
MDDGRSAWPVWRARSRAIRPGDSARLSRAILRCSSRAFSRAEFLHEISKTLMDFSGCDAVELRLNQGDLHYRWKAARRPEALADFEPVQWTRAVDGKVIPALSEDSDLERLCSDVARQQFDPSRPFFTANGSFWTDDAWQFMPLNAGAGGAPRKTWCVGGHYRSLAIMRFLVDESTVGLLHMKSEQPGYFTRRDVDFYEAMAQTLGLAIADRRAERALRERVKELTCLYRIAQLAERPEVGLQEMLQRVVELLPPAWQYPEMAAARIVLDGREYRAGAAGPASHQQSAEIVVAGKRRGAVYVNYVGERPAFAAGAFLVEETKLINAVAREAALIVERREAEQERANLQRQLIHADRLATIGRLAAGVAHELNEPLGSILGFAQLASKCPELPQSASRDIEKIVTASLYAREVIRKLMVFSRQVPARKVQVNVNQVVKEGLYFLEARCAKAGTRLVCELDPELPEICADPAQLTQVLVNLVVNALQAMPAGGTLTVSTRAASGNVCLLVQDTGSGISEELLGRIFLPFFTTKDINEGTGLGLSVVHGIVTAHRGTIDVRSQPGRGTCFEIRLPLVALARPQEPEQNGES